MNERFPNAIERSFASLSEEILSTARASGRNPEEVACIAVSKGRPLHVLKEAYDAGIRRFGESRLQEASAKISCMPRDCEWHFIGTLQSNKIAKIVSLFDFIHSADTPSSVEKISSESEKSGKTVSVLLQVNVSGELSKHGLSPRDWEAELDRINRLSFIRIEGLMTMAPLTTDEQLIRDCFRRLCELRNFWRIRMRDPFAFRHLSMGMSEDFRIAIEEGATFIRTGRILFEGISRDPTRAESPFLKMQEKKERT